MSQKNSIDEFLKRHDMRVLDTSQRHARYMRSSYDYFMDPNDYNLVNSKTASYMTEPLYTVQIPESELDRVAKFEERVFNNMAEKGTYNMFETLMEQKEEEMFLRKKYPAVKKAYEQYSLMLKLAKSGEL